MAIVLQDVHFVVNYCSPFVHYICVRLAALFQLQLFEYGKVVNLLELTPMQ